MRVGWLGLGAMGAPMAACLAAAGHSVSAYDVVPGRAPEGAEAAGSVAEAVTGADAVVVMVATPDQLSQALSGAAGSLVPGQVVVIMSTVGPEAVAAAAARLEAAGLDVVDAPVSGGVTRAGQGDLLILVGGPDEAVARVQPLLDVLARTAPLVGPSPGDGQRMKLVNQLLCGVHIAAAAEALSFAESLGLDPAACWNVLRDGAAASFMFDDRGARMVAGHFDQVRSALDIFVKDMGLVTGAAGDARAQVPLASAARELYQRGHDRGLGRQDDSVLIEVLRDR
ncbi:MAG TPA: NAD(P)-dependent oxidoreductase [Streptosporangiaceae bacterium]|jgi:3-hydroxyisobutyrate dehydrogenase/putative dehydrogenase|nr:NAD(P)-dependent oxidoreductase [Streptosporangiaceae bacterium]